jgi:hypothetical protein
VCNRSYSGIVQTYTQDSYLEEFGIKLLDFPRTVSDSVVFESNYGNNDSFLELKFHCIDGVGNTAVDVIMEELIFSDKSRLKNKVSFELSCSVQQIELFSKQLSRIAKSKEGTAKLL